MKEESNNMVNRDESKENRTLENINLYAVWVFGLSFLIQLFVILIIENRLPSYGMLRLILLIAFQLLSWSISKSSSLKWRSFITFGSIYLAFFVYPLVAVDGQPDENIFIMLMLLIIMLPLPILTHTRNQIKWVILWQVLYSVTFVFTLLHELDRLKTMGFEQLPFIFIEERMLLFGLLGVLIFIVYLVYSLQLRSHEMEDSLISKNQLLRSKLALISQQRHQLKEQRNDLMQVQEELNAIQDQLKARVEQKRKELKEQKDELSKYGFMNSHILRAPISRLKGLMQLNVLDTPEMEKKEIIQMMKNSLADLDLTSQSIDEILNNENPNKLREVEQRIEQIYGSTN